MALFSGRRMYHHYQTAGEQTGASFGAASTPAKSVKNTQWKDGIIFKSMFSFFEPRFSAAGYRSGPVLIKKMRRKPATSEKREGRKSNSSKLLLKETHATRLSPLFYCVCLFPHFVALIKNAVSAPPGVYIEQRVSQFIVCRKNNERENSLLLQHLRRQNKSYVMAPN